MSLCATILLNVFSHFDVPGIFARDFSKLHDFAAAWYVSDQLCAPRKV